VRQPAAFCGVVGLKPTWGSVSRFGLVAYASSLDTVGIVADTTARCRNVFNIISGFDKNDQTSVPLVERVKKTGGGTRKTEKTIGVLSDTSALETEVAKGFDTAKKNLTALGYKLVNVSIPALKYGVPAYYTIATAEASANLARFDTIRYGARAFDAENMDELLDKGRGSGFGDEVKLRILLGTFVLRSGFQDQYYNRAQKIRAAIKANFETTLENLDAILMPVFPTRAFGRGKDGNNTLTPFAQKAADLYTCCANLAGLPALAFPVSVEGGLPVGVQLLGSAWSEDTLLDICEKYEASHPFPHPPGFKAFWSHCVTAYPFGLDNGGGFLKPVGLQRGIAG
jgi:aspartyl-tRNA(Asn)/glutamyl-tRNA(Gln) amidotransferase subunit A